MIGMDGANLQLRTVWHVPEDDRGPRCGRDGVSQTAPWNNTKYELFVEFIQFTKLESNR